MNNEMNLAWRYIEGTQMSVFLTGKAGTGKTTFLRKLRELSPKRMVVLAPTGVAAINAQGQTIHSFFQLPLTPFIPGMKQDDKRFFRMGKDKKNLIRTVDLIVIDEISMVRSDLLDAVDDVLRRYRNPSKPFGGVQLLMIGDLQQLAPVVKDDEQQLLSQYYESPYFFHSKALQQVPYVTIELKHIYRQQDETFISLLAAIRENRITDHVLNTLNQRYIPGFREPEHEDWIHLTTHNRTAQQYNDNRLAMLYTPPHTFRATIEGNFPEYSYPTDVLLTLKVGAQVMFVKNDSSGKQLYYNGKIGRVIEISSRGVFVRCKEDNDAILVGEEEWKNTKYSIDDKTKEITEVVDGSFKQYPLRLAWAITVHKSQGLTFDHAVLDVNRSFAHGQVYVALSRCRSLQGLVLTSPLNVSSVITDSNVNSFIRNAIEQSHQNEDKLPQLRYTYFYSLLQEQFNFYPLAYDAEHLYRVACEHLQRKSPTFIQIAGNAYSHLQTDVIEVSKNFKNQYDRLINAAGINYAHDDVLQDRIRKAAGYFSKKITEILLPVLNASKITIDNQAVKKIYQNAVDALLLSYQVSVGTLTHTSTHGFGIKSYLDSKAKSALEEEEKKPRKKNTTEKKHETATAEKSPDIGTLANTHKGRSQADKRLESKVDTRTQTMLMYSAGKTISEISLARGLKPTTIESHLSYFVGKGILPIRRFVSLSDEILIRSVIAAHDEDFSLSLIKAELPDTISYFMIRCVLAFLGNR